MHIDRHRCINTIRVHQSYASKPFPGTRRRHLRAQDLFRAGLALGQTHTLSLLERKLVAQRDPLDLSDPLKVCISHETVMQYLQIVEQDVRRDIVLERSVGRAEAYLVGEPG